MRGAGLVGSFWIGVEGGNLASMGTQETEERSGRVLVRVDVTRDFWGTLAAAGTLEVDPAAASR